MALEKAGFEVRDSIHHVFGSGFPKSHNVSIAIDKKAGVERKVVGTKKGVGGENLNDIVNERQIRLTTEEGGKGIGAYGVGAKQITLDIPVTEPATPEAKTWDGWGTNLKPAHEVWWLARAPLATGQPISGNVLQHATGALNINGCKTKEKRWPPNFILTHSNKCNNTCAEDCPVRQIEEESEFFQKFRYEAKPSSQEKNAGLDEMPLKPSQKLNPGGIQKRREELAQKAMENQQGLDARGRTLIREDGTEALVARFIPSYSQNNHPTVKSVELMRWLAKMICPPNGTVIDPFAGSGSTGCACALESFDFIGIEKEEEYCNIAEERIKHFKRLAVMPSANFSLKDDHKNQMTLF